MDIKAESQSSGRGRGQDNLGYSGEVSEEKNSNRFKQSSANKENSRIEYNERSDRNHLAPLQLKDEN